MPLVRRSGSRALCTGLLVLSITAIAVLLAPLAHAQTTTPSAGDSASTLRAEADAASGRYFAALDRVQALDADIARNQQVVEAMLARAQDGTRQRACTCAHRVHVVGHAAVDARRRIRHHRHRATRAPHRPRERARRDSVRKVARRRRARCTSNSACCATRAHAQERCTRAVPRRGRRHRRQARPGGPARAAGPGRGRRPGCRTGDRRAGDVRGIRTRRRATRRRHHHHDRAAGARRPRAAPELLGDPGGQPAPRRSRSWRASAGGRAAATTAR